MKATLKSVVLSVGSSKKGIPYFKAFDMEANRLLTIYCPDFALDDLPVGLPVTCDLEGAVFSGGFWASTISIRKG